MIVNKLLVPTWQMYWRLPILLACVTGCVSSPDSEKKEKRVQNLPEPSEVVFAEAVVDQSLIGEKSTIPRFEIEKRHVAAILQLLDVDVSTDRGTKKYEQFGYIEFKTQNDRVWKLALYALGREATIMPAHVTFPNGEETYLIYKCDPKELERVIRTAYSEQGSNRIDK